MFRWDLKLIQWWDYCFSNLENKIILAIEMRYHFTEAATERCSSNLCLAAFVKII